MSRDMGNSAVLRLMEASWPMAFRCQQHPGDNLRQALSLLTAAGRSYGRNTAVSSDITGKSGT